MNEDLSRREVLQTLTQGAVDEVITKYSLRCPLKVTASVNDELATTLTMSLAPDSPHEELWDWSEATVDLWSIVAAATAGIDDADLGWASATAEIAGAVAAAINAAIREADDSAVKVIWAAQAELEAALVATWAERASEFTGGLIGDDSEAGKAAVESFANDVASAGDDSSWYRDLLQAELSGWREENHQSLIDGALAFEDQADHSEQFADYAYAAAGDDATRLAAADAMDAYAAENDDAEAAGAAKLLRAAIAAKS